VVQEILGHSEIGMTMDIHSHVLPTMQREAMDRLKQEFFIQGDEKGGNEEGDDGSGAVPASV
jgi:hypothetical protein